MLDVTPPNEDAPASEHIDADQPFDPVSAEFARLDELFAEHLSRLRQQGRSPLGDAIGGAVIEDGEAEGLLESLNQTHCRTSAPSLEHNRCTSRLPGLERARQIYSLLPAERDLLLLALCVEVDSRYARLIAYLNDHVQKTRPTLGLAMALLLPDTNSARMAFLERATGNGPIAQYGLIEFDGDGPIANREFRIPEDFWPRLVNLRFRTAVRVSFSDSSQSDDLPIDAECEANRLADWFRSGSPKRKLAIVSGEPGSGREALAEAVAAALRAKTISIDARSENLAAGARKIAREAEWHRAAVIVRNAESLDRHWHSEFQSRVTAPLVYVTTRPHASRLLETSRRNAVESKIEPPSLASRRAIWKNSFARNGLEMDTDRLAERFGFGPRRIKTALKLAGFRADLAAKPEGPAVEDVEHVCRQLQQAEFNGLARKLPCPFDPSDIVLPEATKRELDLICTWSKLGPRIFEDGGLGRNLRTGKGLACLFSGPPGTGKTMAAQVIGRRIGYDVYRIDLSQVVNKYVGETEKNLSRVFDEAQRSRVVLFFDEAETLFGDRTGVKSAQDRFANIEIGYLLQRIETYEGIAILATNLQKNLDEAFLRRLSVVADFPLPGPAERLQIWNKLLPSASERSNDIDVKLLSEKFCIAGGEIRNAIFAALLFAAEDESVVGMSQLVRGLMRVLQKSGRIVDTAQFGRWRERLS